jgi:hypothetical protein
MVIFFGCGASPDAEEEAEGAGDAGFGDGCALDGGLLVAGAGV